ncbi:MAG: prolipoprotein diacylglyceryl transferase [Prolixibacteraceae bacterium]|nr:prolipoprotein diacylglyceryl transferase [Prolixibacteraceae bacterium]MBN2774059.1 prolipoprotein diacylglyceryl transferase [Prolixibacteraceae bacterium]
MIIDIENGQLYYDLFYQLSFLVVFLIYLIEGTKRNFPLITWFLIIVTVRIFFITGTKLGSINQEDILYFKEHLSFPAIYSKNMIGGLLLGILAIGLSKIFLRVKYPILDAFAIAVPFGMAVQRVGCLMVGCCFGNPTSLPFGIKYGVNSPAYLHQLFSERIGVNDSLSLSVHPVPFYIIFYSLCIGVLMIILRKFWKRPGNLALSGLLLLCLGRFVVEFFRDPLSNGEFLGKTVLQIKVVQIICLAAVLILTTVIFLRERRYVPVKFTIKGNHPFLNAVYLLILTGILYMLRNWFDKTEFSVLVFVLIPAAMGVIWQLIIHYHPLKIRIPALIMILFAFIIMGQTTVDDSETSYKKIRIGYATGEFGTYHNIGTGSGCGRISQSQHFKQDYSVLGGGYSVVKEKEGESTEYGLNGYLGKQNELGLTSGKNNNIFLFGVNPFINYDTKWYGIGGGLHLGDLSYAVEDWRQEKPAKFPETGSRRTFIYPQFYLRAGTLKTVFVNYKLADHFPSPSPGFPQQIEIGTGFWLNNGLNIRYGILGGESRYLTSNIPINKNLELEPLYLWSSYPYYELDKHYQFSIALHYKFGHQVK